MEFYLDAFFTLSPGRQMGMGPGGILLGEIEAYARIFFVDDVPRLVRWIRVLDADFLAFVEESSKSAA